MWEKRFLTLKKLGQIAIVGLVIMAGGFIGVSMDIWLAKVAVVCGLLLAIPVFIYGYVIVFWHWKSRYRGKHSDLWGVLLCLETSGWFKIVYLFRHIIPDMSASGRYARSSYTAPVD